MFKTMRFDLTQLHRRWEFNFNNMFLGFVQQTWKNKSFATSQYKLNSHLQINGRTPIEDVALNSNKGINNYLLIIPPWLKKEMQHSSNLLFINGSSGFSRYNLLGKEYVAGGINELNEVKLENKIKDTDVALSNRHEHLNNVKRTPVTISKLEDQPAEKNKTHKSLYYGSILGDEEKKVTKERNECSCTKMYGAVKDTFDKKNYEKTISSKIMPLQNIFSKTHKRNIKLKENTLLLLNLFNCKINPSKRTNFITPINMHHEDPKEKVLNGLSKYKNTLRDYIKSSKVRNDGSFKNVCFDSSTCLDEKTVDELDDVIASKEGDSKQIFKIKKKTTNKINCELLKKNTGKSTLLTNTNTLPKVPKPSRIIEVFSPTKYKQIDLHQTDDNAMEKVENCSQNELKTIISIQELSKQPRISIKTETHSEEKPESKNSGKINEKFSNGLFLAKRKFEDGIQNEDIQKLPKQELISLPEIPDVNTVTFSQNKVKTLEKKGNAKHLRKLNLTETVDKRDIKVPSLKGNDFNMTNIPQKEELNQTVSLDANNFKQWLKQVKNSIISSNDIAYIQRNKITQDIVWLVNSMEKFCFEDNNANISKRISPARKAIEQKNNSILSGNSNMHPIERVNPSVNINKQTNSTCYSNSKNNSTASTLLQNKEFNQLKKNYYDKLIQASFKLSPLGPLAEPKMTVSTRKKKSNKSKDVTLSQMLPSSLQNNFFQKITSKAKKALPSQSQTKLLSTLSKAKSTEKEKPNPIEKLLTSKSNSRGITDSPSFIASRFVRVPLPGIQQPSIRKHLSEVQSMDVNQTSLIDTPQVYKSNHTTLLPSPSRKVSRLIHLYDLKINESVKKKNDEMIAVINKLKRNVKSDTAVNKNNSMVNNNDSYNKIEQIRHSNTTSESEIEHNKSLLLDELKKKITDIGSIMKNKVDTLLTTGKSQASQADKGDKKKYSVGKSNSLAKLIQSKRENYEESTSQIPLKYFPPSYSEHLKNTLKHQ